eukprot:13871533-Alexandrium_andersonii.AAC.1
MANDLFAEKKDPKGTGAGEYYVVKNPPPMFLKQIQRPSAAMRNWPKRCAFLGAESSQWPFMRGVGYSTLSKQLHIIGATLATEGVPVVRGRELWRGIDVA